MCALPARRIASTALSAAVLVGIACPAAMAADPAREHSREASAGALPQGPDARLEQLRKLDGGELAPLADLLQAVLKASNGQLSAEEARKLATDAKQVLAELAAKLRKDTVTPAASAPATGVLLPAPVETAATDSTDETLDSILESALDEVEQAVDDLLKELDSADETSDDATVVLPSTDDLLTGLDDLVDALIGTDPPEPTLTEPTALPSLWPLTPVPSLSPVTLPALPSITSALLGP